jgi:Family of unknown function (DUF5686)/CarboxypepD_reg-like domain
MHNPFRAVLLLFLFTAKGAFSQSIEVRGRITDAENKEPLSFASITVPGEALGTVADIDGAYRIRFNKKVAQIKFSCVGYRSRTVTLMAERFQSIDMALEPENTQLQEITVKPQKYRNKNNPAVELIRLVIENRDKNRVENLRTFQENQYEKIYIGLSNLPERLRSAKLLKGARVVLENIDTSKLADQPIVPVMLQENILTVYSKNPPKVGKKYMEGTQSVRFAYLEQSSVNLALRYLNQEIDLYDNYVELLTNQFLSPIADNAPLFYRYYPMDTLEEHGKKIVRLSFFPRNKTDMLLQGDLYIALDSTYPVTKASFAVNPLINLNWVKSIQMEQSFQRLSSGKWLLAQEDYRMDFGITRRGLGFFGQRTVSHENPVFDKPLPDSLFRLPEEIEYLPGAMRQDSAFWTAKRPEPLNAAEAATYDNLDSLQRTRLFKTAAKALALGIIGYTNLGPNLEIGPVNTFYAFNPVEGNRLRFGGRTSSNFSKKWRFEAFGAYGLKDKRWKYGATAAYALGKTQYNQFPVHLARINIQRDIRIPGQELAAFQTNNILTSFVRGINDRFVYYDRLRIEYEREYRNHFSHIFGYEHQAQTPAGALRFDPVDGGRPQDGPVSASKFFLQLRYAPGEKFFQTSAYRQRYDVNYIAQLRYAVGIDGMQGGNYNFHELNASFYKFTRTPPIGYNYFYAEVGGVFGSVPYPLLTIHRANQTYIYQRNSYNLMNFMEFISDRYAAVNIDQNFYGFFLNKIPLIKKLKLRELAGIKILYGTVSKENRPSEGSGLYRFPAYDDGAPITYTLEKRPYVEASVGLSNIFKVLRIDLVRRFNYLDHPGAVKYGIRGQIQVYF